MVWFDIYYIYGDYFMKSLFVFLLLLMVNVGFDEIVVCYFDVKLIVLGSVGEMLVY